MMILKKKYEWKFRFFTYCNYTCGLKQN